MADPVVVTEYQEILEVEESQVVIEVTEATAVISVSEDGAPVVVQETVEQITVLETTPGEVVTVVEEPVVVQEMGIGTQGPQGEGGANWKGVYDSGTAYVTGDIVREGGVLYICTNPCQGIAVSNTGYWDVFLSDDDHTQYILVNGTRAFTGDVAMGSHKITGLAGPTSAQDAATKAYVDAMVTGLDLKGSVKAASVGNLTLSGAQTVDGVALVAGDRVLVKNQTTGSQNGIYVVASGAWSRAADADSNTEVTPGMFVFVEQGTVNADSGWVLTNETNAGAIILGTTALTFTQFSSAGQIVAGAGLTKSGNTLDVGTASSSRIVVNADNIDLATSGVTAGTYLLARVAVDAYGRVTTASSGTNDEFASLVHAATSKATPVDADEVPLVDSAASYGGKKLTWANIKATLKTYFDTLYAAASHTHSAYVAHSLATAANDFLVASGAGAFVKKTLAEVKTILGLGAMAYKANVAESDLSLSDVTTGDVSTTKHGLCPKAPNDTAKFLRGDGSWATVPVGLAKYSATVGDGSSTTLTVTHNLGSRNVIVQVFLTASPYEEVEVGVERYDANTVKLYFASAPASGAYTVVVIG